MPGRRSLTTLFALSTLGFVVLAVSAFFFLRLPPAPVPFTELGWPAKGPPELVLLVHGRRAAWTVDGGGSLACYIDLGTARARHCVALPAEEKFAERHAYGRGHFLFAWEGDPRAHFSRIPFAIAAEDGALHAGEYALPANVSLFGAAWDDAIGRFRLYVEHNDLVHAFESVEINPDGRLGAISPLPVPQIPETDEHAYYETRAFFVGDAASALVEQHVIGSPRYSLYAQKGDKLELVDPGVIDDDYNPLMTASESRLVVHEPWPLRWFDSLGRETLVPARRFSDFEGHLVEDCAESGSSTPLLAYLGQNGARIHLPSGASVSFSVRKRGDEGVQFGQVGNAAPRRIARDVWMDDELTVIPSLDGFVLLDSDALVVLDHDLARKSTPGETSAVREVLAERWRTSHRSVVLYLLLLFAFPVLGVFGARAFRAQSAPPPWLPWVLRAHVVLVALLLLVEHSYLFPP